MNYVIWNIFLKNGILDYIIQKSEFESSPVLYNFKYF